MSNFALKEVTVEGCHYRDPHIKSGISIPPYLLYVYPEKVKPSAFLANYVIKLGT